MKSTMMHVPLSLNHLLERAGTLFPTSELVSRRPDKSLVRHSFGAYYRRTRSLAAALQQLGLNRDCPLEILSSWRELDGFARVGP